MTKRRNQGLTRTRTCAQRAAHGTIGSCRVTILTGSESNFNISFPNSTASKSRRALTADSDSLRLMPWLLSDSYSEASSSPTRRTAWKLPTWPHGDKDDTDASVTSSTITLKASALSKHPQAFFVTMLSSTSRRRADSERAHLARYGVFSVPQRGPGPRRSCRSQCFFYS